MRTTLVHIDNKSLSLSRALSRALYNESNTGNKYWNTPLPTTPLPMINVVVAVEERNNSAAHNKAY